MDLQFVWGNPRSKKSSRSLASRKTSGKNNKKHRKGKSMAKRKSLKKKNPIYATYKKTDAPSKGKKQAGAVRLTSAEASELRRRLEVANNNVKKLESLSPANKKKPHKALIAKYKKSIPKIEKLLKTETMSTAEFKKEKDSFKNLGYSFDKLVKVEGNFFSRKKKRKAKKKGASVAKKKKKSTKKKAKKATAKKKSLKAAKRKSLKTKKRKSLKPKKAKAASKKKYSSKKKKKYSSKKKKKYSSKKKKSSKKVSKKKKYSSKKKSRRGKKRKLKKSFTVNVTENPKRKIKRRGFKSLRRKSNPLGGVMNKIEQALGHSMAEAGSLALGGALYGVVNSSTAKYLPKVHQTLAKVPVIGTALPTLLVGALLNHLGQRQKINALSILGKGLVGASVVGAGVNASQMVPGLRPATLKGVDYTMEGLGEGGEADFGAYDSLPDGLGEGGEADFGGVDYTMEGVDYTMEGYGEGGEADFGDDGYDGEPEGMGDGQMG